MVDLRSAFFVTVLVFSTMSCETGRLLQSDLQIPEENYDLLTITKGPCAPKIFMPIEKEHQAACSQMNEPRLYRGTWYVDFETSYFTPVGRAYCGTANAADCIQLKGESLPWPKRSDCMRAYQIEFVGRRNLLPHTYDDGSAYRIMVDRVLSVKRLPDPPQGLGLCSSRSR